MEGSWKTYEIKWSEDECMVNEWSKHGGKLGIEINLYASESPAMPLTATTATETTRNKIRRLEDYTLLSWGSVVCEIRVHKGAFGCYTELMQEKKKFRQRPRSVTLRTNCRRKKYKRRGKGAIATYQKYVWRNHTWECAGEGEPRISMNGLRQTKNGSDLEHV
jgi:hypothetical protein